MFLLKAFVGYLKDGKCSFDVAGFMQTVVLPGMSSSGKCCGGCVYIICYMASLQIMCYWLAGRYGPQGS